MKRGATILNFVLIFGMVFVAIIVVLNLQKIVMFQSRQVEVDASTEFVSSLISAIERAEAYPTDTHTTLKLKFIREYTLTISNGLLEVYFPREDVRVVNPFTTSNLNIIPNSFKNSAVINIYIKNRNLLVSDSLHCDPADSLCDPGCTYKAICDPSCYSQFISDVCNPFCIDQNNDKITNAEDADALCDPDCYNNYRNGGYYDIDCVNSNDGICDPDTADVVDNICDGDCKKPNGICDPDCGEQDADC
ncbi:MAG: hypothetical protein ABIG95_01185 [Candidatus Woesearchaeota archaeon]